MLGSFLPQPGAECTQASTLMPPRCTPARHCKEPGRKMLCSVSQCSSRELAILPASSSDRVRTCSSPEATSPGKSPRQPCQTGATGCRTHCTSARSSSAHGCTQCLKLTRSLSQAACRPLLRTRRCEASQHWRKNMEKPCRGQGDDHLWADVVHVLPPFAEACRLLEPLSLLLHHE